jgi:hypothetical protein
MSEWTFNLTAADLVKSLLARQSQPPRKEEVV